MQRPNQKAQQLLVRDGWRHFRRSYSTVEAWWGLGVFLALITVAGWLWWRGANPDPLLYAAAAPVGTSSTPQEHSGRTPFPANLAGDDWKEGAVTQFTADNLYVKINGRADYFLSFGFRRLYFVPLTSTVGDALTIDVEIYDLGTGTNALGAFAGENPSSGQAARLSREGMTRTARNALFMARGEFYVRAIGSNESEVVTRGLRHVEQVLDGALAIEDLPWAYTMFMDGLGVEADAVSYHRENAFSFEFARDVYVATLDESTEVFIVAQHRGDEATALAGLFVAGFASYGEQVPGEVQWVKDRYIGSFATAVADNHWVLGVRGAPNIKAASAALSRVRAALAKLPLAIRARAVPAPTGLREQKADQNRDEDAPIER